MEIGTFLFTFIKFYMNLSRLRIMSYKKSFETFSEDSDSESDCINFRNCNPRFWQNNGFQQFLKESTIHGLKYIGREGQLLCERIFWSIAVVAAVAISTYLIFIGVVRPLQANPVLISFQNDEITIDQIPFPAVTICNINKVKQTQHNNIIEVLRAIQQNNQTGVNPMQEALALNYLRNYCSSSQTLKEKLRTNKTQEMHSATGYENVLNIEKSRQLVAEAFHQCNETIFLCLWQGEQISCSSIFSPIETEFAYCCSFNIMPKSVLMKNWNGSAPSSNTAKKEADKWTNWDIDRNAVKIVQKDNSSNSTDNQFEEDIIEVPRRQRKAGALYGLSVVLNPQLNEYVEGCTAQDGFGFRVQVHSSIDNPHVANFGRTVKPNTETFIAVQAEITIADPEIRNMATTQKECYFLGDLNLTAFNYYTQQNCFDECSMNLTFEKCNCTQYYMPRTSQPLCYNGDQFNCLKELETNLTEEGISLRCKHCLPSCTQMDYEADTSYLPLRDDVELWKNSQTNEISKWANENVSIVNVYFTKEIVETFVRKRMYGPQDILAKTGGLLSLTLGFSMISIIEPIYFLILRIWRKCKQDTNKDVITSAQKKKATEKPSKNFNKPAFSPTKICVYPSEFMRWSDPYSQNPRMRPNKY